MTAPWVLVAWAHQFRSELAAIAPNRDRASDGSIGDQAHQSSPSGHNPDETGNAERRDADGINEVRAIDVDKDLRVPGLTAQMIVAYLVGRCRAGLERRLIYIIFNGVIWTASSGWVARHYTGSNPHTEHFHLSGHPDGDADRRPFGLASLLPAPIPAPAPTTEDDMELAELLNADFNYTGSGASSLTFRNLLRNLHQQQHGPSFADWQASRDVAEVKGTLTALAARLDDMSAKLDRLAGEDAARATELAALVRAGQTGEMDAAEVVRLMGERLAAAGTTAS